MQFFRDTDLVVFLATVGQIFVLGPAQLRKNVRPLPKVFEIETVRPESLTETQQRHLAGFDDKLARLNYRPVHTYRAVNYGQNLLRSYINPTEPVRCVLMIVEVTVNVNGIRSSNHSSTLEFFTYFTDESVLVTRNMRIKSVFEEPPYRITQECPRVSDPAELRRRHIAYLQQMNRLPKSPANAPASIAQEFQSGHERFCEYQLSRGNLRLDPCRNCYFTTAKVHWRGILNHLNPFVQRFALAKFLAAALSGIALPVLGSEFLGPLIARSQPMAGLPGLEVAQIVTLTSFALAGALVGLLLQKSSFLWTFIFTYLGVGAILGFHSSPLPCSTIAALVGHAVAQWQKNRNLILQPKTSLPKSVAAASAGAALLK